MKVAYYSPMPPERSGIADYSALLVPALARRVELHVQKRGGRRPPRDADVRLYHVGNDPDVHGWIVEALRSWPGVVVLHEFVLHHLVAGLTLGRRDVATYLAAMEREGGLVGRLLGLGVVDGCIPPLWESRPEDFPLAGLILDATEETGLIVHSRYVERLARDAGYGGPVWRVPHPVWPPPSVAPADLGPGPLVGCLGNLNATKRVPQLLEAFSLLRERVPEARILLVGATGSRFDLDAELERVGLPPQAVVREGFVDEERFWALMGACDACVSLRSPTMGETSGSVVRALALGKPLVVSEVGWFAELPDDVAIKAPLDEHEVPLLARALEELCANAALRSQMTAAARAYAEREHGLDRVADLYAAALEEAAGGPAVREAVVGDVAQAAADVGIALGSPEAARIADRLRESRVAE